MSLDYTVLIQLQLWKKYITGDPVELYILDLDHQLP